MSFSSKLVSGDFDRDRFLRLVGKACEECIEEYEMRELEVILKSSAEARALFRSYTNLHVTLGNCFGAATQSVSPGTGAVEAIQVEASHLEVIQIDASHVEADRSQVPRVALAAAAAVILGIGGYLLFSNESAEEPEVAEAELAPLSKPDKEKRSKPEKAGASAKSESPGRPKLAPPPPGAMAFVKNTVNFKQGGQSKSKPIRKGTWITHGEMLDFESGMVRLKFLSGATATIKGPAHFQIVSENGARLEEGDLFSRVPPSASDFKVATPTFDVVDVGTAFGVMANTDGVVEVHVYEGAVNLHTPEDAPKAFTGVKKLRKGQAVRARLEKKSQTQPKAQAAAPRKDDFESVTFAPERFQRLSSVNAGVSAMSQKIRFQELGPEQHLRDYEHDRFLYVFPERKVELTEPLEVTFAEPGDYYNSSEVEPGQVGAGRTVRSYLLQFNPVGKVKVGHAFKGSITFDERIFGIITQADQLKTTNALFATDLNLYRNFSRGMDFNAEGTGRRQGDIVTLSENGRTVRLDWVAILGGRPDSRPRA